MSQWSVGSLRTLLWSPALHHSHPAVHSECMTDDVAGCRTTKKQHGGGNLVGRAGTSDGVVLGNLGNGALHHRLHLRVITHVTPHGDCFVTSGNEFLRACLHRLFFEVGEDDGRSRLSESLRRRQSHTCCCTGDKRHLAAKVQWIA